MQDPEHCHGAGKPWGSSRGCPSRSALGSERRGAAGVGGTRLAGAVLLWVLGKGGLWCGSQFFPNVVVCSGGERPLISAGGMLRALQSIHGHLHNRLWFGLSLCWSCWPTRG